MAQLQLGKRNLLKVLREKEHGVYLEGGDIGDILLPKRYVTADMIIGQPLRVFLYLDQEERIVATTETPLARVGEFAWLECSWTNEYGAFLDWGLMKDLFCPFREQKQRMQRGGRYYVYVMEDPKSHRLMATAKVERFQKLTGYERALDFADELLRFDRLTDEQKQLARKDAASIAKKADWKHFFQYYRQAYDIALTNAKKRQKK